jgi:hypothetical protein
VKFGLVVVPEHPADAPMVRMLDEAMGQARAARDTIRLFAERVRPMLSASGGDAHA